MEWFKVSSGFYRDAALLRAGEQAEVLFVRALGYCMEHETGGRVDDAVLPLLVSYRASARALRLVSEGLWTRVEGGYEVRSWAKWQETADALAERKKADRERQSRLRERRKAAPETPDPGPGHVSPSRDMSRDVTPPEKSREEKKLPTPNGVGRARKRAARLDPSWTPSQEEINFALSLRLDPSHVAAKFRDYWLAKSGRDATKADWTATWRNWCRREAEHGSRAQQQPRPSTTDQRVQAGRELVAHFAELEANAPQLRMLPGRSA